MRQKSGEQPTGPERKSEFWKRQWGCGYAPDFKRNEVVPILHAMDSMGRLGTVLLDLGSGSMSGRRCRDPTPSLYYPTEGKRIVRIDFGMPYEHGSEGPLLELRADIEHLALDSIAQIRRYVRLSRHLGLDPKTDTPKADTIILCDILNYVDHRKVILSLLPHLSHGGRLFISNIPGMGPSEALSPLGVEGNRQLADFVTGSALEIEHLHHPSMIPPWMASMVQPSPQYPCIEPEIRDRGSMILVAKKISEP